MAKRCLCHQPGKKRKPGYHEHRCECPCGCTIDTLGYALCASCSFDEGCWAKRGQVGLGPLGLPLHKEDLIAPQPSVVEP